MNSLISLSSVLLLCTFLNVELGAAARTKSQAWYSTAAVDTVRDWQAVRGRRNSPCPCSDKSLCEPVNKQHDKEVFVFSTSETNWKQYPFKWNLLTTIGITYAGSPLFDPQLICTAHAHNVRVVPLVDFPKRQLLNGTARSYFVKQTLLMVQSLFLDGVNLDFEEPISSKEVAERGALTALTMELFLTLKSWNPNLQISFDTPFNPECNFRCYDYVALAKYTDFLFLMAYDESGDNSASSNSFFDLTIQGVRQFEDLQIPSKNIVLGLPWYGYIYPCSQIIKGRCVIKPPYGRQILYTDIMELFKKSTSGRLFDDRSLSPYFNLKDAVSGDLQQVWYDDKESLDFKCSFARSEQLRGVGTWTADTIDYSNTTEAAEQRVQMWGSFLKFNPVL